MAREVFTRRAGSVGSARTLSVSTEGVTKRLLADPGDYHARIGQARLVEPRRDGNISVVLELIDPETDAHFDVRPLWIDGPNAGRGNMVGKNIGIIADLLEAIGIAPDSYKALTDELLSKLVGRTFELTLDIDRGARGGMFNIITVVQRAVEQDNVTEFPNSVAD